MKMVLLVFISISPQGLCQEQSYGDHDLESCLDGLSQLIKKGWQLVSVRYFDLYSRFALELPVEAFDGQAMKEPIRQLQEQWQSLIVT